jgi:hypothetical protein
MLQGSGWRRPSFETFRIQAAVTGTSNEYTITTA